MRFSKSILIILVLYTTAVSKTKAQALSQFSTSATWKALLIEAKSRHKNIFVDCYASWCGPCKMMDNTVYTEDSIASFLKNNFVSVKLQMDSTGTEDPQIKAFHREAAKMMENYNIDGLPTYLFFDENGNLFYRSEGYQPVDEFRHTLQSAVDSISSLSKNLTLFKYGRISPDRLPVFVNSLNHIKSFKLSNEIAGYYVNNYLLKLRQDQLYTKENLNFITFDYLLTLQDVHKVFDNTAYHLLIKNRKLIDKVTQEDFAEYFIRQLIWLDYAEPIIIKERSPNWDKLRKKILTNFPINYAERAFLESKLNYYTDIKKDKINERIEATIELADKFALKNWVLNSREYLNNFCYNDIFQNSNNKRFLRKGINYVSLLLTEDAKKQGFYANWLDTKANLYYKLGEKKIALQLEKSAIDIDSTYSAQHHQPLSKELIANLAKMNRGLPTWK